MKFLILKKVENFYAQNLRRFTFFWWNYLIKGG